jgi:predicted MPP superfamily phosphohydrolase
MGRLANLLIFAGIVTGTYFLMNWYVLDRFSSLFGFRKTFIFYLIVIAAAISLPAALMLDMRIGNWLTGIVFATATMWVGICFLFVWCLIGLQLIGLLFRIPPINSGIAAVVIVAATTIYSIINAMTVYVHKVEIAAPANLRIVQISDIHIGSTGGQFFSGIIDRVNELKPDVVLVTGDLVDSDKNMVQSAIENLNKIQVPIFFVSGNHEKYVGYDNVRRMLASTKVKWLRNEAVTFGGVQIIGIDDHCTPRQMDDVLKTNSNGTDYRILMYHRPEWLDTAENRNVNLMLTGHTHRGQIWPFNFVVDSIYKFIHGMHEIGKMHLFVSTGTGTWGPRMRLGTHSEIIVFDLKRDSSL